MLHLACRIDGIGPYSQSKLLQEKRGKKESWDEFENRVWRLKAHVAMDGDSVVIPAHGIHQALVVGAQKGRLQPTAAKSAREGLANRLVTGITLMGDAVTDMKLSKASCVPVNCHASGKRGSATRVVRKFPQWATWTAEFDIMVLDESLTEQDVKAALASAGLVCGLGRFRPENMGSLGRFLVSAITAGELKVEDLQARAKSEAEAVAKAA